MPVFDITITRTGSIAIEAVTMQEAFEKYGLMSVGDIEKHAQLTGWEASDAELLDD